MHSDSAESAGAEAPAWPLWARIGFRFTFLYWALYALPTYGAGSLLDALPWGSEKLGGWIGFPLLRLTHWAGVHIFHLSGEAADWHPTGSGDTAMNYVLVAVTLTLALIGAAIWCAVDERAGRRREYRTAYAWLRLVLRFTLAITLLEYGFVKVFPGQFGLHPSLWELNETYGESTPMHVLWFLMTSSRPYTIFGGLAEVIPGVLLLFRRTSTLGLLGAAAVMANIVAMNFCYDVPVKLYSTHLLLMALYLLLPDARALWEFFVRRRPSELTGVWIPVAERRPLRIGARVLRLLFLAGCMWTVGVQSYRQRVTAPTPSPLRGVWAVDALEGWPAGDRPKLLVLDTDTSAFARWENGKRKRMPVKYESAKHELRFTKMDKDTLLRWQQSNPRTAQLQGTWMGSPVTIHMHRTDPDSWTLTSRGFHWVQETAFNQ